MNKYQEYLNEILDTKISYKVVTQNQSTFKAEIPVEKGKIIFIAENEDEDGWHVVFMFKGVGNFTYGLTNDGEPLKILSFIMKAFDEFIQLYRPPYVVFTSDKDTKNDARTKVYEKLGKRYSAKYGYNFTKVDNPGSGTAEFSLVKK